MATLIVKNIPTNETYNGNVSCIEDRSCYDEGKRVGETLCYFYQIKEKVNVAIFRPFNVFGPGMPKNDYRVFPRFFSSIKIEDQSRFLKMENKQEHFAMLPMLLLQCF